MSVLEVMGARSRRSSVENREILMTRSFVEDPNYLFIYSSTYLVYEIKTH